MSAVVGANLIWLFAVLLDVAVKLAALAFIPRDRKPTAAMAWLLAIFLIPYVGVVLFLVIGNFRLPAGRRREQERIAAQLATPLADGPAADGPRWFQRVSRQNLAVTGIPVATGTDAGLIDDHEGSITAMADAVSHARFFVHVEFYIVALDETTRGFFAAMEAAVARGVEVRLLADYVPSRRSPGWKDTFAELDRIGVSWSWMLPVRPLHGQYQRPDLRNHRKIVVVDGTVAFVGSQNLIDRSYNLPKNLKRGLKWQELVARLTGPAVAHVDAVFRSDWIAETGQQLAGGPAPVRAPMAAEPCNARRCPAARASRPRTTCGCSCP